MRLFHFDLLNCDLVLGKGLHGNVHRRDRQRDVGQLVVLARFENDFSCCPIREPLCADGDLEHSGRSAVNLKKPVPSDFDVICSRVS
jgi:hypothetical protein